MSSLIPERDQRDFLIYAFRYALGRQTYAPHSVIMVLREVWGDLSRGDRALYKREIREAIEIGRAGADFDSDAWANLLLLED